MRKFTVSLIPAFVLALAAAAAAQGEKPITTNKEMTDTVKVNVTGRVVLDYIWRSQEVTFFTSGFSAGPGGFGSDSENTFEGYLGVAMNVDLSDKVSAVVEFGTKRADAGVLGNWGDIAAEGILLREAHVMLGEFLMPELKLQVGISTWNFDVRGRGSSFAFDPRRSQPITSGRNVSNLADGAGALGARAGFPDEMDPVGIWFRYQRDAIAVDVVALPAALEGGAPSDDEAILAVDFWYNLDSVGKGSRIGAILAVVSVGDIDADGLGPTDTFGTGSAIFTLGGGASLKFMDGALEVYGEVYFQFGDVATVESNVTGNRDQIDAGGMAFQAGVQYNLAGDMKPWVGFNLTWITGDDDTSATDDEVGNFLSYENVNDLLILEDMYFGFDWDTNYFALKFSGGVALSMGAGKNNFEISGILGIANAAEDVEFGVPVGGEDALGIEVDGRVRWIVTKQASLNAAIGLLFGSDIMEESMGGSGNDDSDDSAILYTLGADLRF
jgi:hypothetical protein